MTLNAPLSVRVSDGTTDRHVTRYASGLGFAKVAPGGHQSCRFRLNLPRDSFGGLGPQDKCWIYSNTGDTIFGAAYLENPTPVDGPEGQSFDISAMGGMALASDQSAALTYVDRASENWRGDGVNLSSVRAEWGTIPDGAPGAGVEAIVIAFTPGQPIGTGSRVSMRYPFTDSAMEFGHATLGLISGKNDSDYETQLHYYDGTWGHIVFGGDMSTSTQTAAPISGSGLWPIPTTGITDIAISLERTGAPTNIADDLTWTAWPQADLSILGRLLDRNGDQVLGSGLPYVLAHQVAEDLLGRVLTFCDPVTATIDAATYQIDQLVYRDGAKAASVLSDLSDFEPDHWWGIGATGDNGLHEFWYREYATEPRYVVSVEDGWRQTGSDADLCNQIQVSWTDAAGKKQSVTVTAASLGLVGIGLPVDALGSRVKQADPITLPEGRGSEANALQVGAGVLRDKINPPLAGTINVRRPIVDMLTGSLVYPWELEPGWPVLVREPGHTLRCTQMTYDDSSVSASLTLGRPVLTTDQRLAKLARVA